MDVDHRPFVGRRLNRVAVAPAVRDLFERFDFHTQIEWLDKANLLYLVAEKFATIDPHPDVVSNEKLGTVFEELIRRFVKRSNATAAEHFTSREVIRLRVNLMFIEDDGCSARSSTTIRTPSARRTCSFGVERKKIEKEVRREHEQQGFNGRFGLVLPTDLFYNTGIARYVWVVINKKPAARQRLVQLIDASGKDLTRWGTRTNGQLFLRVGRWRNWQSCLVLLSRGDRIRTCDLVLPKHALYRAKLRPVDCPAPRIRVTSSHTDYQKAPHHAPRRTRTSNLLIRSQMLYPIEL